MKANPLLSNILCRHITFARQWSKKARELKAQCDPERWADPHYIHRVTEYCNARQARWICMQLARQVRTEFQHAQMQNSFRKAA